MINCIGLFGTCGNSKWRDLPIEIIERAGKSYFNPVVSEWNEEAMRNEVFHANHDKVIMLVITGETTGIASMVESGWIAKSLSPDRTLILVVEDCQDIPEAKQINKVRKLLREYISKDQNINVHLFDSIIDATYYAIGLM